MKNINRILGLAFLSVLGFACTDEDTFPFDQDAIINNNGAFVRLDEVIAGEFDLNDLSSSEMGVELEVYDIESGGLLRDVTFSVEFIDNSAGNGSNPVPAVELGTFPASSFTRDPETGLPNIVVGYTADETLAALGLTAADLDGGDVFRFEWTLNLTDGRSFNRNNQSGSLPAWDFYNSPFLLDVGVVCLLPDGFATGAYRVEQTEGPADPFFGNPTTFYTVDTELTVGATSTERVFDMNWISFPSVMGVNLVCGRTSVSSSASPGASCGTTIVWITNDTSGPGAFDGADDSVMTMRFVDDFEGTCGITSIIELTLTKL